MPLKLYKNDISGPARAVMMTLELLKVNYETQDVDTMGGEQRTPAYMDKNPMHTVPMIEEDDFVLADSHAIMMYLTSKYGGTQLYPSDLRTRATVDQRLFFEATGLMPPYINIVYGFFVHGQQEITPEQIEAVNASYEILDRYLQKTKFVACDHLTIADISCAACVSTTNFWVPVDDKFTKVKAWLKALEEEDWYKKNNLPGLTKYISFMKTKFNSV